MAAEVQAQVGSPSVNQRQRGNRAKVRFPYYVYTYIPFVGCGAASWRYTARLQGVPFSEKSPEVAASQPLFSDYAHLNRVIVMFSGRKMATALWMVKVLIIHVEWLTCDGRQLRNVIAQRFFCGPPCPPLGFCAPVAHG